jgi:hypothetical protein
MPVLDLKKVPEIPCISEGEVLRYAIWLKHNGAKFPTDRKISPGNFGAETGVNRDRKKNQND